ncbi:unnamed protein product [Adineta steineri]|uniref:Uncharacterized protein n=1 Tax=Adineta steineri TaxID=433720 RepID=A0A815BXD0_9BILA|nr:unnamed protein product [Adineta steineri]CAF3606276.1 unnamed protein product [Adineta steineri]
MFYTICLFYSILLHWTIATPHINLYYTDKIIEHDDDVLQHNCIYIPLFWQPRDGDHEAISYCMSELPSKFNILEDDFLPKFTFAELSRENITSQQLYLWSAPIDVVEHYEFYLNQSLTSPDHTLAKEIFYNCTLPRFGPMCQYELPYDKLDSVPLHEFNLYLGGFHNRDSTNLTCYIYIPCDRGPFPSCLDWTEVCDGKFDCLNGNFDEEYCSQSEITEYKDNEFRVDAEQSVLQSLYSQDYSSTENLFDSVSDYTEWSRKYDGCIGSEPSLKCEDHICKNIPLTSSCSTQRQKRLLEAIFSIKNQNVSDHCWSAFKCIIISNGLISICNDFCNGENCIEIIKNECPDMFYFPAVPVLFGHIYLAYEKNDSKIFNNGTFQYPYVCYNNSRYDNYFVGRPKLSFKNTVCYRDYYHSPLSIEIKFSIENYLFTVHKLLIRYNQALTNTSTSDCPRGDDENSLVIYTDSLIAEEMSTCDDKINVLSETLLYTRKNISFQTICDGYTELYPVIIDRRNETDETECQQWPCDNIYTHCDGFYNCWNGADELGCNFSPLLNCPLHNHICVSPITNQFMCLPITKANDDKIDCLGAIDEQRLCRVKCSHPHILGFANFYCIYQNSGKCIDSKNLCNRQNDCDNGDDEQFCRKKNTAVSGSLDWWLENAFPTDVENFLLESSTSRPKPSIVRFTLNDKSHPIKSSRTYPTNTRSILPPILIMPPQRQYRCFRGLDLNVWLNKKIGISSGTCLCPPSYYGDQCQYQNQRVSVTSAFRTLSDSWETPFVIIISLIDNSDERISHSYEQFTYLFIRDCELKFNNYFIYSTRPKNQTKKYAIHIDIYEQISLSYRASFLFPITRPFLPVHHRTFIIDIPRDNNVQTCSSRYCVHGKCIKYSNNQQANSFCQCEPGWSGRLCTISHNCTCSSDSLCIGISANKRSICVCRIHTFGTRCFITNSICQNNDSSTCNNHGKCVPSDEYRTSQRPFTCICSKGFSGDQCEIEENKIILSFNKDIKLSQSLFIHFIEVRNKDTPLRITTHQTIPFIQHDSLIIKWSRPFHIVFIELSKQNYYLTSVEKIYNQSSTITKLIQSSDRCYHISELFNETIFKFHLLRRIKYYHLPCQNSSLNLSCFYDDIHLCLCYDHLETRLTNCFEFNHKMTFDCSGENECINAGQCFQETVRCHKRSMCVCPLCFYGRYCQFTTSGFGLSLDSILGYHIRPHTTITHQSNIVKVSIALTVIFILAGFINGILAMITFNNKKICEVGCGLYLLGSSITTLLITILFGLKFWILILAQMAVISNELFLKIQCISLEFLLRICLNMDQWLNACVACERAITIIKGTRFVKRKSRQAAKLIIVTLLIFNITTLIYDPIYRQLLEEKNNDNDDEKRIWCIVDYSPSLQIFNSIMHIFQFFAPFMINLISAIILITKKSQQQSNVHTKRNFREILREQFRQHKHLLIAPVLLVILAIPRLIITFTSKCMQSSNESWLFLIGYFITFIPPMLTFVIFILPSKFYKKEFKTTITQYRTNVTKRLQRLV